MYSLRLTELFKKLEVTEKGLTEKEANFRIVKYGLNLLNTETKINRFKLFLSQFKSFIIYIMLFAVVFSLLLNEYSDAIVILFILISNALIGYYQELNAQKSMEALKKLNIIKARVKRDNELKLVDSKSLVPGDVIFLEAGDQVPADARILKSNQLKVEESVLTGESLPVEKMNMTLSENVLLGDQKNMLFASTRLLEGTASALVVKTGMQTELGKITSLVKETKENLTPLQLRLEKFGHKLGIAVIIICVTVFLVISAKSYLDSGFTPNILLQIFLIAVALAVAAVPSGLPAVVTIALSVGIKKLLAKNALVRKLASVETLGSCDVICCDKTGTLTQNEMTVKEAWTLNGNIHLEGIGYDPSFKIESHNHEELFEIGKYCNNASISNKNNKWEIVGDPTEAALLVSAKKAGLDEDKIERLDELAFDSDRKRMSVMVNKEGKSLMFSKGAPDKILEVCDDYIKKGSKIRLNDNIKDEIFSQINEYSKKGMRVLAFAKKEISDYPEFEESALTFVGLQAMTDPPREEVPEAIKTTKTAGIRVIMITGDYSETARSIGKQIGIEGNCITGEELDKLSDAEIEQVLDENTNIFARVIPEHKQRIVGALQRQNHIVAMTGDGVNDAPALKKADIGIAVGSGTDVAKEASDFVLLNDSFSNIVKAIEEGRGIYENIQKAIMHLLSGNLSEVLIIFLAVLLGWPLPLTAIMLLWINLITDGTPALALAVDPYGKDIMQRIPRDKQEGILPGIHLRLITILGVFATFIALGLFYYSGGISDDLQQQQIAQTTIFNFIVISEFVLLITVRQYFNIKTFSNLWLWSALIFCLVLQAVLMYTPLKSFFQIYPLDFLNLVHVIIAGVILYLIAIVVRLFFQYKQNRKDPTS